MTAAPGETPLTPGETTAAPGDADSLARPQRGQEVEVEVDSLAYGGDGVGRLGGEGYVVFVAGAIPGDRARAVVYKRKRSYARARAVQIVRPSPQRLPPKADHPGVPWQVLPYEVQLEVKSAQVDDALRRIGGLSGYELEPMVPAVQQWRYRNKLEYSFGRSQEGELILGFHAPAGWNRVVAIEDCLLASELGNRAREVALRWAREQRLTSWERSVGRDPSSPTGEAPAGDIGGQRARTGPAAAGGGRQHAGTGPAADGRARLRNLVVREGRRTGMLQVRLVSTPGELDGSSFALALADGLGRERLSGVLWTRSSSPAESTGGGETELLWGSERLGERIGELELSISQQAFLQTNSEMAEVLYGVVSEYAALEGFERVYDLCCGIGSIALSLAGRAGEVWGVDIVEEAIGDAIAMARRGGWENAKFLAGDVRTALPELKQRAGRPDVVVVDPPRAGLSSKVVRRLVECWPKRIVYVSCNPTTLAPNAAQLVEAGWRLVKVRPVDMFPQTHHIECVALLERDDDGEDPVEEKGAAG